MRSDLLHVVVPYSNPILWESRPRLYRQFEEHMLDSGVKLTVVECVLGERDFQLHTNQHVNHIGVRHKTLIWHKESLINIGISRLPHDARYIAWIDADIHFRSNTWAADAVHALQQYEVIQLFEHAYDLGPKHGHLAVDTSFMKLIHTRVPIKGRHQAGYQFGHPGYAWGATRRALENLGGLIDFAALGSADHNMAMGFLGRILETFPGDISPQFTERMLAWQGRAVADIGNNTSYIPGTIEHQFHGEKKRRGYIDRWEILRRNKFNPVVDIRKNLYGVIELTGNKRHFRHDVDLYFRSRNEDANHPG